MENLDKSTQILVFKVKDFKEKDKLLQVFSLELGLVNIIVKNVKTPKSKLKWLCQPFCFAEVMLSKLGDYYIVTNANLLNSFYETCLDIDKLYSLSNLIVVIDNILPKNEPSPLIFLNLLKTLQLYNYEEIKFNLVYCKFLLDLLSNVGYKFNTEICFECKNAFFSSKYLSINSGAIICNNCANEYDIKINDKVFNYLKLLEITNFEKLKTIKIDDNCLIDLKQIIESYFKIFFNVKFISY